MDKLKLKKKFPLNGEPAVLVHYIIDGADRQPRYSSNYTLQMALCSISYAMSPIIVVL